MTSVIKRNDSNLVRFATLLIGMLALPLLIGCDKNASGDADVNTAMRLFDRRKFAEAIPHLEKALDKPLTMHTKSQVLSTIGNCYNELEQFEVSLEYHDRAIQEDPQNHSAYVNKGVVYRLLGEYDQAEAMYTKALELAPEYPELHASMGALAIYQDEYDKAVEHLEKAVQLDDTLAIAHSNLAYAYATVGRFDDAEAELKKATVRGYHQPEVIRERIDQLRKAAGGN